MGPGLELLKNFFTGGAGNLAGGIAKVVDSINAPKEMKEQLNKEITVEINRHLEEQEAEATKQMQQVLEDTKDARDMNMQIQTSDKPSWLAKNIPYCLAIFMTIIWGTCTIFVLGKMMNIISIDPKIDMAPIALMYGGISTLYGGILNFYFGSTHSSKDKDATIATLSANQVG